MSRPSLPESPAVGVVTHVSSAGCMCERGSGGGAILAAALPVVEVGAVYCMVALSGLAVVGADEVQY
jgi:hypothetical protein